VAEGERQPSAELATAPPAPHAASRGTRGAVRSSRANGTVRWWRDGLRGTHRWCIEARESSPPARVLRPGRVFDGFADAAPTSTAATTTKVRFSMVMVYSQQDRRRPAGIDNRR